jgi:hypothetical protein
VAAALDDAPAIEHHDLVRHAHRGEAVRDENRDAIAGELAEMLEHLGLRLCVHRGRRLIEHEDIGPGAHESARQRDLLPLTAGELAAIAEPFAELRVVAGRQLGDELARLTLGRGLAPALLVLEEALIPGADILPDEHLVARKILKDDADALAQRALLPLGEILAIEQDPSGAGRVQARQ